MQILPDISGIGGCSTTANWKALRDASAFIGSDPLALIHFNGLGVRQLDPEQPNVRDGDSCSQTARQLSASKKRALLQCERDSLYA